MMKRKKISILLLLVVMLLLSGCKTNIDITTEETNTVSFDNSSEVIFERTISSQDPEIPIGFTVGFDKKEGELSVSVKNPNGKIIHSGELRSEFVYPDRLADDLPSPGEQKAVDKMNSLTEEKRTNWGYMSFTYMPEIEGEYTLQVQGISATGTIQYVEADTVITEFTGKVEHVEKKVEEIGEMINFTFPSSGASQGKVFVRVFDPTGEQIRVVELTANNPIFKFQEAAKMTGTYTAYIEAENATVAVGSYSLKEEQIPNSAFIAPILIVLLGIIAFFFVKRENRKLVIWGALFWLGAYFVGSLVSQFLSPTIKGLFYDSYMFINVSLIISFVTAILFGVALLLIGMVADIRKATPKELIGFGAGFVIAPAILEGLNGIMNITALGTNLIPFGSPVPGVIESAGSAFMAIGVPVLSRIGLMVSVFAFAMTIIWVIRQKEIQLNKGLILTGSILGITIINFIFSYANILATQSEMAGIYSTSYPLGTPLAQGILITLLLLVIGLFFYSKRSKLLPLAEKSCPVTIEDMGK